MGPPPPDGPETLELVPGPPRRWAGNPGTHAHVQVYTLELRWPIPESRANVVDSSVLTQLRSYCFASGACGACTVPVHLLEALCQALRAPKV